MQVKITITRSEAWVRDRRLATGENIPECTAVDVEVQALSLPARLVLLEHGGGAFSPVTKLTFSQKYTWSRWDLYGSIPLIVDADAPTLEQIDAALCRAADQLREKRTENEAREAALAAEIEHARQEKEAAARRLAEAREVLADELATKDERIKELRAHRETLSEFLTRIPVEVRADALRELHDERHTLEDLQEAIEDASTRSLFG